MARLWLCLRFRFCRCLLERVFFCFLFCSIDFLYWLLRILSCTSDWVSCGIPALGSTGTIYNTIFSSSCSCSICGGQTHCRSSILFYRSMGTAWRQQGTDRSIATRGERREARDERRETRGRQAKNHAAFMDGRIVHRFLLSSVPCILTA